MSVNAGEIEATLRLRDELTEQLKAAEAQVKKFGDSVGGLDSSVKQAGAALNSLGGAVKSNDDKWAALREKLDGASEGSKAAAADISILGVGLKALASSLVAGIASFELISKATGFIHDSVDAALEADQVSRSLTAALRAQGETAPATAKAMSELATQYQYATTFSDEMIKSSESLLTQVGGVLPRQMNEAIKAVTNLAAGLGIELRPATLAVAKAFEENFTSLKRFGVNVDEARAKAEGMDYILGLINAKFGGQAQADAASYAGQIKQVGNQYNELKETLGNVVVKSDLFKVGLLLLKGEVIGTNTQFTEFIKTLQTIASTPLIPGLSLIVGTLDRARTAADVARDHNEAYVAAVRKGNDAVKQWLADEVDARKKAAAAAEAQTRAQERQTAAVFAAVKAAEAEAEAVRKVMQARLEATTAAILSAQFLAKMNALAGGVGGSPLDILKGTPGVTLGAPPKNNIPDLSGIKALEIDFLHLTPAITDSQRRFEQFSTAVHDSAYAFEFWARTSTGAVSTTTHSIAVVADQFDRIVGSVQALAGGNAAGGIEQGLQSAAVIANAIAPGSRGAQTLSGASAGAGVGTLIAPGIGTAIGAGVGAIAGYVASAGAARDMVKEFANSQGGFTELHKKLQELDKDGGTVGEHLWISLTQGTGNSNSDQAQDNINAITKALNEAANAAKAFDAVDASLRAIGADVPAALGPLIRNLSQLHDPRAKKGLDDINEAIQTYSDLLAGTTKWKDIQAEAEQYGLSLDSLNSKFQQAKLESSVRDIAKAWQDLSPYVDDAGVLAASFADEVQNALNQSFKFGVAIPDSLKPLIKILAESGVLLDANGLKLDDLSKINFEKDPLTEGLDKLNTTLQQILKVLQDDLPKAFSTLSAAGVAAFDHVTAAAGRVPKGFNFNVPGDPSSGESNGPALVADIPVSSVTRAGMAFVRPGDIIGMPGRGGLGQTVVVNVSAIDAASFEDWGRRGGARMIAGMVAEYAQRNRLA